MSSAEEAKPEQQQPEAEMQVDASKKRKLDGEEEQQAAGGGDGQPAAKAQKTEGEGTAEAGEAPAAEAAPAEPVQIGYKAFATGKDAQTYFHGLVSKLRKYQNLNEYEFHMVHELIKAGHPDAARKLEGGVHSIQIRDVEIGDNVTSCFFLIHSDGSDEDVSYRKCLAGLFPELKELAAGNASGAAACGGGRGRGGGGRGRGGGRGGRGGGRGGRGRGGR